MDTLMWIGSSVGLAAVAIAAVKHANRMARTRAEDLAADSLLEHVLARQAVSGRDVEQAGLYREYVIAKEACRNCQEIAACRARLVNGNTVPAACPNARFMHTAIRHREEQEAGIAAAMVLNASAHAG